MEEASSCHEKSVPGTKTELSYEISEWSYKVKSAVFRDILNGRTYNLTINGLCIFLWQLPPSFHVLCQRELDREDPLPKGRPRDWRGVLEMYGKTGGDLAIIINRTRHGGGGGTGSCATTMLTQEIQKEYFSTTLASWLELLVILKIQILRDLILDDINDYVEWVRNNATTYCDQVLKYCEETTMTTSGIVSDSSCLDMSFIGERHNMPARCESSESGEEHNIQSIRSNTRPVLYSCENVAGPKTMNNSQSKARPNTSNCCEVGARPQCRVYGWYNVFITFPCHSKFAQNIERCLEKNFITTRLDDYEVSSAEIRNLYNQADYVFICIQKDVKNIINSRGRRMENSHEMNHASEISDWIKHDLCDYGNKSRSDSDQLRFIPVLCCGATVQDVPDWLLHAWQYCTSAAVYRWPEDHNELIMYILRQRLQMETAGIKSSHSS